MNKKVLLFASLSVLTVIIGLPLTLKQDWGQFSGKAESHAVSAESVLINVTALSEESAFTLQQLVGDSIRILFRFPPGICDCLEAEFSDGLKHTMNKLGMDRILVVIAAKTPRDIRFFRDRTKLTCHVFSTTESLHDVFDRMRKLYACVLFPDLTIRHVVSINPINLNELIANVRKIID